MHRRGAARAAGVPEEAITIIPDEQEAIDAALRMGQPGDLLLVFADALVRSWKQITKFKPDGRRRASQPAEVAGGRRRARRGSPSPRPIRSHVPADAALSRGRRAPALNLEGLIRDERGVRFAPETED